MQSVRRSTSVVSVVGGVDVVVVDAIAAVVLVVIAAVILNSNKMTAVALTSTASGRLEKTDKNLLINFRNSPTHPDRSISGTLLLSFVVVIAVFRSSVVVVCRCRLLLFFSLIDLSAKPTHPPAV